MFNFDTPWHPDDYVHRIGRTGRAGAKGKAFTLVTPEDAEAIANVEKLTGLTIPVFDLGGESGDARRPEPDKAGRPSREEPRRESRRERPEPERPDRDKRDREPTAPKAPKSEKPAPRADKRRPEPELAEAAGSGEWNGPVPGFLNLSAL